MVEADHGKLKQLIRPVRGFKTLKTAYATIKGFEVMRGHSAKAKRPASTSPAICGARRALWNAPSTSDLARSPRPCSSSASNSNSRTHSVGGDASNHHFAPASKLCNRAVAVALAGGISGRGARHRRRARRDDHLRRRAVGGDRTVDRLAVVRAVGQRRADWAGDLVEQRANQRGIPFLVGRQLRREDLAGIGIDG